MQMATLHVRNVPDQLYEILRRRAEANGRSIGAETEVLLGQQLLTAVARPSFVRRRRPKPGFFSSYTEPARAAVVNAQDEARALGHDHIGTEHLLLGLLCTENGAAAAALQSLGLELGTVRGEVERRCGRGPETTMSRMPFTPAAKKSLDLALQEAFALGHDYIGTEHVLLGLLRAGEGLGQELVRAAEPDDAKVRRCVLAAVATPTDPPERFRVVELKGSPETWEAQLNDIAAAGYELEQIVDLRAIFRRS